MSSLKLKPSDRQSIDFAEEERLKSKNLWNAALRKGCYLFNDGTFDYTNTNYVSNEQLIDVEPNSTITLSFKGISKSSASGFVFFNNGVFVSCEANGATTAVVPSNANQVAYNFFAEEISENINNIYDIQLEYSSNESDFTKSNGGDIVRCNRNIVRRETIYNMDTTFENKTHINGVAYTSGIKIDNDNKIEIPIDTRKVQKVIIWITANSHGGNWFCDGAAPLIIDLRQPSTTSDAQYRGNLLIAPNIHNKTSDYESNFYGFTATMDAWDAKSYGVRSLRVEGVVYNYTVSGSDCVKNISTANGNTCDNIRITKVEVEIDVNSN